MAKNIKVGGVGIPNIDAYPPKLSLLTAGLQTLRDIAGSNPTEKQLRDIATVEKALEAREKLYDYIDKKGGLKKGAKEAMDADAYEDLKTLAGLFVDAAHVLNGLPLEYELPEVIHVKHLGGTITNKMNAYKGGRGDNIQAFIIGVTGNDANGAYIKNELRARGITLLDNKVRCDSTQLNYIITEDRDGNPLGDRHILKGKSNAVQVLRDNEDFILDAVSRLDRVLIEGGEISAKRFGPELFEKILDAAISKEIDMAYAPCTSTNVRNEDPRYHAILDKACYYRYNDMPTVFNLEELLENYLPKDIKRSMPAGYKASDNKTDPYVHLAIANLKLELAHREKHMPITNNQPLAIVSDGSNGLFIMTSKQEQTLFVPAISGIHVVDTTGAGDNLTAGAFVKATQLANTHRNYNVGERQNLSDEELVEIAQFAQKVAVLAVQQYGACVPADRIIKLLKEDAPVPVTATLDGVERIGAGLGEHRAK